MKKHLNAIKDNERKYIGNVRHCLIDEGEKPPGNGINWSSKGYKRKKQ